jgi:Protein of unknown function (DUF3618)
MSRTDDHLVELERQIAETREQLGRTVEELAAAVDVPTRAKAKAHETAARTRARAAQAAERAKAHLPGGGAPAVTARTDDGGAHLAAIPTPQARWRRHYLPAAAATLTAAFLAFAWTHHQSGHPH